MTPADLRRLFDEHMAVALPQRLQDEDVAGVDVVMLDADVAGCVTTWLQSGLRLDDRCRQVLGRSVHDADRALSELTDAAEIAYVSRVEALALAVIHS